MLQTNSPLITQPTTQKQTPSFKAINLVQIPKKAFANPENIGECDKLFRKQVKKLTADKRTGFLAPIVNFYKPQLAKTASVLEHYSYYSTKREMERQNVSYSLHWVKQNTGLPIKEPLDNEFHSFYVYTKEHKDSIFQAFEDIMKKIVNCVVEGFNRYPNDKPMAMVYANAKRGLEMDAAIEKLTADTPINKFKINSIDELKNIVKDLNV